MQPIDESLVRNKIKEILFEETKKIRREEYNKIQFKIEEFENQLVETIKELRKVDDAMPEGLKTLSVGRVKNISENLIKTHNLIKQLKNKIREHKKMSHSSSQIDEKNKK
jgi:hypothetical protein